MGLLPKSRCHTYLVPFIVHCRQEEEPECLSEVDRETL